MLGAIVQFFVAVGEFYAKSKFLQGLVTAFNVATVVVGIKGFIQARNMLSKGQDILLNKTSSGGKIPVIYGTRRVGAQIVYMDVSANDSRDLYVVYALSVGECDEIIGRTIELDGNPLTDSARFRDGGYIGSDRSGQSGYSNHRPLNTVSQNGTGINAGAGQFGTSPTSRYRYVFNLHHGTATQTADPMLVASMPNWTTAHKLNGVAYICAHYGYDRDGIWNGIPQLTVQVKGRRVYDPRESGQTFGNPSTYAYTNNPALCFLDFITDDQIGKGLAQSEINMSTFSAAANLCDYEVEQPFFNGSAEPLTWSGVSGDDFITINGTSADTNWWQSKITEIISIYDENGDGVITGAEIKDAQRDEFYDNTAGYAIYINDILGSDYTNVSGSYLVKSKRFHCNGVVNTNNNVMDNAKELLANMRGIFLYINGNYELKIEDSGSPTFNITEDHIIGDSGISVDYGKKDARANKVVVEFFNANKKYELDTATVLHTSSVQGEDYTYDDGGEELEIKAEFAFCTDPYIANNMAKAILERSRNQLTMAFVGSPTMYLLNVGDIVSLTYAGLGFSSKQCVVEALELQPNGLVSVNLIEYFDVYTWEVPPQEPLEKLSSLPSAYAVKPPTGLAFTDTDSSDTDRPFLSWNEPTDFPTDQYRVNVVDSSGNQYLNKVVNVTRCELNFTPTGNNYVATVTSLNSLGVESTPVSHTFNVVDMPAGTPDIKDDAITNEKLGDGSVTNVKVLNLSAGKINTGELNLGQASGMAVRQTKTGYTSTATGFWLGNDGGTPKFNIGTSTNYLKFDGTDLDISGEISATTGEIGGFTVGDSYLRAGTGTTRITLSTVDGIHLGNNTFASAPFRVALNGDLTATNATIDGNITATTLDVVEANIQNLTLTLGGGILQDGSGGNLTVTNVINPDFPVDGLLHYFPLNGFSDPNDIAPADIIDVVNDVTGVITGSNGSFETDSPNGQSYVNGATTGITLLNNAQATTWQSTTGDYTVALWFKSTTELGVALARIIGRDASDFWSLALDQNETGNQTITLYTDGEGLTYDGVSVNEWHHIALVVNGTTSAKVYVDGILRITDTNINYTTESRPVVLGCNTENVINTSSNVFLGKFSDVRFYTKNITDKQVQSLYMNPAGGLPAKIEGDLFVTNSITADKLIVSSLSSLSANLGSVTAGQINIGSGAFTVNTAGVLDATGASINGTFIAGSGTNIFTADTNGIYLGNGTFANAPFKVLGDGEVQTTKTFTAGVAGSGQIAKMSGTGDYRFWSGSESPSNASFAVDKDGKAIARNLVLKLTDGTVYFDSETGFSDSALSQIGRSSNTKVTTVSTTTDSDSEYEEITVTANTDVNVTVSIDSNFGGFADETSSNDAIDNSEKEVPANFTLTIQHSSDGGSSYNTVVTDEFRRVNDRLNPDTSPDADEYKINSNVQILWISGQGGTLYLGSTTTSLGTPTTNVGCVDSDGRTTLSHTGLTLTGTSSGTTHRIKATVSSTDTVNGQTTGTPNYDAVNNNVTSTTPRVISVTDPTGDGFYVDNGTGSTVPPEGDITGVQITTASSGGLTGGANFTSGDASFTLALASSIDGARTFTNNVVIQGNLDIQGTTTTIDTANLDVKDKNITLNYGSGDTSANANGAGITIQDAVSAGNDATLTWATSSDRFNFSHGLDFPSSALLIFGDGDDFRIQHTGSSANISNYTGDIDIKNFADDSDIKFWSDDGSGNSAIYFRLDGSMAGSGALYTKWSDNSRISLGDSNDLRLFHNGTNSYIQNVTDCDLVIQNDFLDRDIYIRSDDGAGGLATYILADGSTGEVRLFHYGAEKLNTTTSGIEITGSISSGAVNSTANITATGTINVNHNGTADTFINVGTGTSSNHYAYIDLVGDSTYTDYGLRLIRNNSGANTSSAIYHRGTGDLIIETDELASIKIRTDSSDALTIDGTQNATFAGNISVTGTVDGRDIATDGTKLDGISAGANAITINNNANNRIITGGDVANTLNGESGLTYDGSTLLNLTGQLTATSHVQSGANSGGVALTINDGYGNANVTFNHLTGVPEQDGNSARIEVNTDSGSNAIMYFELKSSVTSGTAVQTDSIMQLNDNGLYMDTGKYIHGSGGVTINADDADFVVEDNTDGVTNFIWRDFSASKLYLGTATAVVTLRSNLDALDKIISAGNLEELQIFNDGSNSVIRSSDDLLIQRSTTPRSAIKVTDSTGKVELYYAGSAVLETTSTGISVTDTINFTDPTAFIRNSQDASGQIIISALNSSSSAKGVRWDVANNADGAWRPEVTAISNLGLTNRVWDDLFINTIKMGSNNDTFVDASRNVTARQVTTSNTLSVTKDGTAQNLAVFSSDLGTNTRNFTILTPASDSATAPFEFSTGNSFQFTIDNSPALSISAAGKIQIGDTVSQNSYGLLQVNQEANDDESGIGILSSAHNRSMRIWVDETNSYINSGDGGAGNLILNQGTGFVGINKTPISELNVDGRLVLDKGTRSNPSGVNSALVIDYRDTGSEEQARIRSRDWDGSAWKDLRIEASSIRLDTEGTPALTIDSAGVATFAGSIFLEGNGTPIAFMGTGADANYRNFAYELGGHHYVTNRHTSGDLVLMSNNGTGGGETTRMTLQAGSGTQDIDIINANLDLNSNNINSVGTLTTNGITKIVASPLVMGTGSSYQNYVVDGLSQAHQYLDTRDYMVSKGHHAGAKYIVGGHSAQIHLVVPYVNGTDVFVDGVLKIPNAQADGTVYQILAADLSAFSEITADKPISVMATNPSAPTMNTNYSGRVLGLFVDRYQPIDIYVYSPFAKVTVEFYKKSTAPVDASSSSSGDFVYTTTIDAGSGFIFQEDVHGGGTSSGTQYFIVKADGLICAESMPQGGGDYTLLSPASMELVGSATFSPASFGYTESSVTSSITAVNNGNATYYRDNSGKNGIFAYGTADGAGGDAEFAVPIEYLSDYYIYNEADLTNFRLVSYKTNTIKVLDKQNNVLYTYDHRAATKSAPMYSSEGADSGSGGALSTNGAFKFIGTAPFHLVCQNEEDDEMVQLGAMQRELYTSKNIDFKSTMGSPVGDISPFDAANNTLTFLTSVAHQHGIITGATLGVVDLSTGELEITQQGVITIKSDSIEADKIAANTITANEIASDTITGDEINVDTLNVKSFDNVSSTIVSHITAGTKFPLARDGQAYVQRTGTYTGSNASFVPVTITQVRDNAGYVAIFSGVLGNVSGGRVQYSLNNSTWVNANGNTNIYWNAGTYRGYTYVYTGQITTLSASQSNVYWRVYFSGGYNHTQLSLNVMMDNTR
jgi:hypothetical protein